MRAVLLICLLAAAGGCSLRQMERWRASGDLELDVRGIRREPPAPAARQERVDAGLALRAQGGPGRVGIALGLDLHLGGGTDGGFAYEAALRPLGAGLDLGGLGSLSFTAGAGMAGLTGRDPIAFRLPLEARLEVDLNPRAHVRFFGELDVHDDHRRAGAALRLGKGGQRYRERWGNGAFLGVLAGERDGVRELGLVVGYGITDRYVKAPEPVGL